MKVYVPLKQFTEKMNHFDDVVSRKGINYWYKYHPAVLKEST